MNYEQRQKVYAETWGRMSFEQWMAKVDAILMKKCGLDSRDLDDWRYADAFEEGESPAHAARDAYEAANGDY